jgi:DNA mismatch endonuclease, patch repair protein
MADVFSKEQRSRVMAAVRSHGNKETELKLIAIFRAHRVGGWRRNSALPGHPDFVFPRERIAVFVDGCFWHGCPRHATTPESNRSYWMAKIARNVLRDRRTRRILKAAGWRVVRIWAHSLRSPLAVVRRITSELSAGRNTCNHQRQAR